MEDLKQFTIDLMNRAPVAYMSTVDVEGLPQVRAVENFRCVKKFPQQAAVLSDYENDPLTSYLSINTSSRKLRQVENNPVVALYYSVPEDYRGVMLRGKAVVHTDLDLKKRLWMDSWTRYYPLGAGDPDFTLLKVKPDWVKSWYRGVHEMRV